MADSSVIREFLVALGFQVDEREYRDWSAKIDKAGEYVETLGKVAITAGAALGTLLVKTASQMTDLYYSAQRAGTSVGQLMSTRFAGGQVGIGADALAGDLESMASTLRSNPGMYLFFKQLGLPVLADNTKNFTNMIVRLKQLSDSGGLMGHSLAAQIASGFGIDEPTLQQLFKNLPAYLEAQKQFAALAGRAGIDLQKNAALSTQFSRDVGKLWQGIELIGIAFENTLLPFAEGVVHFLQAGVDAMLDLNDETKGWSSVIATTVATLLGAWGALKLLGSVAGLLRGGGAIAAEGAEVAEVGAGGAAVAGGASILGPLAIGAAAGGLIYEGLKHSQGIESFIAGFEGKVLNAYKDVRGSSIGYGHHIKPGENFSGGITDAQAAALLTQDTATAQAAVQRLVKVALNSNQMKALTDFVYNEGAGALQGSTLLKRLNAGDYAGAADEFSRWNKVATSGGFQANADLTQRRLGEKALFTSGAPITVHQDTDINIYGVQNPEEAANRSSRQQRQVNGDLVRNLAGATQ